MQQDALLTCSSTLDLHGRNTLPHPVKACEEAQSPQICLRIRKVLRSWCVSRLAGQKAKLQRAEPVVTES